jgi:hypothetical protein
LRCVTLGLVVVGIGVVLLLLVVDVLVGRGLLDSSRVALRVRRVVVTVLVVVGGKIYLEGGVLLGLGCWWEGALEE